MKIKKKVIVISSIFLSTVSASAILGGVFYGINAKNNNKFASSVLIEHEKYPFLPGDRDIKDSRDASFDFNLKEIKEPILVPEPEPIPEPIKPEIEPEPIETPPEPEKIPLPEPEDEKKPEEEEKQPEEETPPESPKPEEKQPEEETPPKAPEPAPEPEPKPTLPEPEPTPQPKPLPPEPKKEEPKPTQPDKEKPKEKKEDDITKNLGDNEAYVEIAGTIARAKVIKPKGRTYFKSDIDKGITNLNPYTNNFVSKVVEVEVTDALKEANLRQGRRFLKDRAAPVYFQEIWNEPKTEWFDPAEFIRQNWDGYYSTVFHRFKKLFDGPNLAKFLTDEGVKKLPELMKIEDTYVRYSMYLKYLDHDKLTETTDEVNEYLKKGYEIGGEVYIDENGKIGSYSFSPPSKNNSTTARMTRDNSERRVFGYNSYYWRDGDSLNNGVYPGWTKTDITNNFTKYGASKDDGIVVERLTRDSPSETQINEGTVVTIDASNKKGYAKTLKFIQDTQKDGVKITSYRIKNMGLLDSNQNFAEILRALPTELPQLELFFESTNTSSLIELESKHIKELSLYTSGNSLRDSWSINPNALRKVEWINNIDYNVSKQYAPGLRIFTRITFDSLSFDPRDYDETAPTLDKKLERINDGLRMAYYVRNNEPFFQGSLGPGNNPDNDEKGNSYPLGLDLSRVPQLKSLRGLVFRDVNKPENGSRKLKRLVLFNNDSAFTISASELNEAQFKDVLSTQQPQMPRTKVLFSNGSITNKIRIITPDGVQLNSDGIQNLRILKEYAPSLSSTAEIDLSNSALSSAVSSAGFNPKAISNSNKKYV